MILVTGGFGFIGSHLVERLLEDGHHVHVVDNLSTSPLNMAEILHLFGDHLFGENARLSFDICDIGTWHSDLPITEVYHLASPVGPAGVLKHTGRIVQQIVNDTYHVIKLALEYKAKLVDVSTSEVYGGGQNGLCAEDMDRVIQSDTTARLEYAVGKLAAETAILNMAKVSPLKAVIIRPFNVAGPRQAIEGGFVLPRFITQAIRGEPLTIFNKGRQIRAFTHVSDIVDGLILAMKKGEGVYNLGNPANKITIMELARKVNEAAGGTGYAYTSGKMVYGDLYAEAHDKYPDSAKAMMELGWSPKMDIDEIIADVLFYHMCTPIL